MVDELVVYENRDAAALPEAIVQRIERGELDWIGLSSPSIARRLADLLTPASRERFGQSTRIAAISPVTADAAQKAGLAVHAVADTFTSDGLFAAIVANHHSS